MTGWQHPATSGEKSCLKRHSSLSASLSPDRTRTLFASSWLQPELVGVCGDLCTRHVRVLLLFGDNDVLATAIVLYAAAVTASALPASASMATEVELCSAAINSDSQGSNQDIACSAGNHGVTETTFGGVIAVADGRGVRVWLQGASGWTFCVSPHQYTTLPGWAEIPTVAGVSTNTAGC